MKKRLVISERIYHKLWDVSLLYTDFEDYYKEIIVSKEYRSLEKSGFGIDDIYNILKQTHELTNMPISDFLYKYNIKTSLLSHKLCIPTKTIENWKYGCRECPVYMKLIILKIFDINIFPRNIYIENYKKTAYNKNVRKKNSGSLVQKDEKINDVKIQAPSLKNKEDDLDINNESYNFWSLRNYEQNHFKREDYNIKSLLSSTDYLDSIIKRKNKNNR